MCLSLASDFSESIEVIIIKFGTVTASDMIMYHVLVILTLNFIQGHTALNREHNTCSIISENVQTIPITLAVMIVQLRVYIIFSQSDDLDRHSRLQLHLKLDSFF